VKQRRSKRYPRSNAPLREELTKATIEALLRQAEPGARELHRTLQALAILPLSSLDLVLR